MIEDYKINYHEDLTSKKWLGIVVDADDPLRMGRAKVRIFEKFDQRKPLENGQYPDTPLMKADYQVESNFILPNKHLPWVMPTGSAIFAGGDPAGGGNFSTPKVGSLVKVEFYNDDIYSGEYTSVARSAPGLVEKIKNDYVNAHSILYDEDEDLWVLYTQNLGLQMYLKESQVTIRPDSSIYIEHKDSSSIIELKGPNITIYSDRNIDITSKNKITNNSTIVHVNGEKTNIGAFPNHSAVAGEPLATLLLAIATAIDLKVSPTPGAMVATVESALPLILSKSVKVSL